MDNFDIRPLLQHINDLIESEEKIIISTDYLLNSYIKMYCVDYAINNPESNIIIVYRSVMRYAIFDNKFNYLLFKLYFKDSQKIIDNISSFENDTVHFKNGSKIMVKPIMDHYNYDLYILYNYMAVHNFFQKINYKDIFDKKVIGIIDCFYDISQIGDFVINCINSFNFFHYHFNSWEVDNIEFKKIRKNKLESLL